MTLTQTVAQPVRLEGIGHYFPGTGLGNEVFAELGLDVDDAWIRRQTGVEKRHWPDPSQERHAEMGVEAARLALKDAGLEVSDVDLIIGTTATARPRTNPSSLGNNYMDIALPVQQQLGALSAYAFDVQAVACAGFLYGSTVARALLSSTQAHTALVVCAESPKNILNFGYRNSVLFGAGAAAAVWRRTSGSEGCHGLRDAVLKADGRHFGAFDIDDTDKMIMDGRLIGKIGPDLLTDAAETILRRNGLDVSQIDWLVPHQGNLNMVTEVVANLGLAPEKLLLNLPRRGNTSSVGIPGCLSEYVHDGTVHPGDLILAIGIGRGVSWGAMLFSYK